MSEHLFVRAHVGMERDLDDVINAVGSDVQDLGHDLVRRPVVRSQYHVRPSCGGDGLLCAASNRGDDLCAGEAGQGDGRNAHGTGPTLDQ